MKMALVVLDGQMNSLSAEHGLVHEVPDVDVHDLVQLEIVPEHGYTQAKTDPLVVVASPQTVVVLDDEKEQAAGESAGLGAVLDELGSGTPSHPTSDTASVEAA